MTKNPKTGRCYLIIATSLLFLLTIKISAQKANLDSLLNAHDTVVTQYYKHLSDSLATGKLNTVHTTQLNNFQRYNPLDKDYGYYATLGNVGLAHRHLIFEPRLENGFHYGVYSFRKYIYNSKNVRYFLHDRPLTFLSYVNGAKREQLLKAMHSQRIGQNVIIAADVSVINSPGYYVRQKSDDRSVNIAGRFKTNNNRYGFLGAYFFNKFVWEENGGIANDSIFENNIETNRQTIEVNLQTAENTTKESGFYVNQYFYLTKAKPDSLSQNRRTFHLGRISHNFTYNKEQHFYTDSEPLSGFYSKFDTLIDTVSTADSMIMQQYENTFTWSNLSVNDDPYTKPVFVSFSLKHQYADIRGYLPRKKFTSLIPSGQLILRPLKSTYIEANGSYTIGDFNNNGFYIGGFWRQEIRKDGKKLFYFRASAYLTSREKGYFYSNYQSNYLRWENDFKNEKITHLGFLAGRKSIKAEVSYYLVGDFIYLDENARPKQHETPMSILRIRLNHHLQIRKFSFDYDLVYQQPSNNDILRLPVFMGRAGVMFTLPVFRNASVLQPGLDFFYNTAYYADHYRPSIRGFYLQNEKKIGVYLYADVYINLLLKRFRFFLKYQHLNSFLRNNTYYMVPHYPMQDAALKFGISWSFYD
jgi:hypothetical protein